MKRFPLLAASSLLLTLISLPGYAEIGRAEIGPSSFDEAKRAMPSIMRKLQSPSTLYCGCSLIFERNRYYPDLASCGYQVRKDAKRAARIEAEHIMPAWEFGHQRACWAQGRRSQCSLEDRDFQKIEGDLHNLYPAVGEVNGDRSNFRFSEWNAAPMYGQCEMAVDFKSRRAQPPVRARGIISRAYLYMSETYEIRLSDAQRRLFEAWDKLYAPTDDECLWNSLVTNIQGRDNRFVSARCRIAKEESPSSTKLHED